MHKKFVAFDIALSEYAGAELECLVGYAKRNPGATHEGLLFRVADGEVQAIPSRLVGRSDEVAEVLAEVRAFAVGIQNSTGNDESLADLASSIRELPNGDEEDSESLYQLYICLMQSQMVLKRLVESSSLSLGPSVGRLALLKSTVDRVVVSLIQ